METGAIQNAQRIHCMNVGERERERERERETYSYKKLSYKISVFLATRIIRFASVIKKGLILQADVCIKIFLSLYKLHTIIVNFYHITLFAS